MNKYVITFSKKGYIKFTSHLDMNRMFRRMFRKAGINLAYSQGYNPHPKMNFAQPLSLGYEAENEMLEITTKDDYKPWYIKAELEERTPEGIIIKECDYVDEDVSSLAALATEAEYKVTFPLNGDGFEQFVNKYIAQKDIVVEKLNKKKKVVKTNIREKIRSMDYEGEEDGKAVLDMKLDCGSASNLSPEFVIKTFIDFNKLGVEREDVDVVRKGIKLSRELRF